MRKVLSICMDRSILAIILLGLTVLSPAYAYTPSYQAASWSAANSVSAGTYRPVYGTSSSAATAPKYQFQSTSSFSSIVNSAAYNEIPAYMFNDRTPSSGPVILSDPLAPGDPFTPGDPTEDPIGTLPDPMPIGEPFILLAFALLYALIRYKKHRTA